MARILSFAEAIREATLLEMRRDPSVFVMGQGSDYPDGLKGTTIGLVDEFGPDRVFDTPISEDGMTGVAIGAALSGLRPIHTHLRVDFLTLAMNQITNIAAKTHYMSAGALQVPLVIRAFLGGCWGAQHSQGLHSWFAHIPGLIVVAPSTPYDAKGILIQAIRENNPVVCLEHTSLVDVRGEVPRRSYTVPFGKCAVRRKGSDVTLVGISYMNQACVAAAGILEEEWGVSCEVIDPISVAPLDMKTIIRSVRKTGHLVVADNAWTFCGVSAEISAQVAESLSATRNIRIQRVGFPQVPAPHCPKLEERFQPNVESILKSVRKV
ncbi:MAG: alpha-ketoacid dehydrogenase subunit beta, partial [Puniceicoccales bacterium]